MAFSFEQHYFFTEVCQSMSIVIQCSKVLGNGVDRWMMRVARGRKAHWDDSGYLNELLIASLTRRRWPVNWQRLNAKWVHRLALYHHSKGEHYQSKTVTGSHSRFASLCLFVCLFVCLFFAVCLSCLPKWLSAGPALLQIAFLPLKLTGHKDKSGEKREKERERAREQEGEGTGEKPMKPSKRLCCALLVIKTNKCVSINLDLGGVKQRIRKKRKVKKSIAVQFAVPCFGQRCG